ncbi:hypothetical protein [Aquimarina sp. AU119]|uniref:hypothetical protein n=1 Tax=Aquimarina sp. AU119 TaxID=2108528 RepID=UPI000D6975E8|nr:hypothetical protein [Aquimarina sp. AU119]
MTIKSDKLENLIRSKKNDIKQGLDYFKNFLTNATFLNSIGVLEGNDSYNQIVEFINVDEMFNTDQFNCEVDSYKFERERLISNIYLHKEKNKLYDEILKLTPQEFIEKDTYQLNKLSANEIESIRLKYYHDNVFNLLVEYVNTIEKISYEYDLKNIDKKIKNRESILYDSKITLYSPLLFRHEEWEKIILNDLLLSNSIEEMEQKKITFLENLIELETIIPYDFKNLPLIHINETNYWLNQWNDEQSLFIYPIYFWLGRKKYFLESLGSNKLKRLFNKELIMRYNDAKKIVKKLKDQLRRDKIEVREEKYLKPITQGLTYLLSKENSSFSKTELRQLAEKLITNLFYSSNTEPEDNIIDTSIKINNIVLVEFILFLRDQKQYLTDKKISIPRLISDNLNYKSKGYSYQNLNKIYKAVETKKEFKFNGLTSVKALLNEMKMRNY